MPTPTIQLPYLLPFEILASPLPLLSTGGDVIVMAGLEKKLSRAIVQTLESSIQMFASLAEIGGLSGSAIPPWESGFELLGDPDISSHTITWRLSRCRLDDRAILVLINVLLLEAKRLDLRTLSIHQSNQSEGLEALPQGSGVEPLYPAVYERLPFDYEVDEAAEGDSRLLSVAFEGAVSAEQYEALQGWLSTWAGVTMNGAFADPPNLPSAPSLLVDPNIEVHGHELEWSIEKIQAHPSALDSLVNVLTALHHEVASITAVAIG